MTPKTISSSSIKPLKELSIQVSLSGLSFCIYDSGQEQVLRVDTMDFDQQAHAENLIEPLHHLLDAEELYPEGFTSVKLIHDNELSALVPSALFNESNLPDYLKYTVKLLETDFITFDEMPRHELVNVYVPFTNVNNFIYDRFGSFEYKHASTVFLESILNLSQKPKTKAVYAEIYEYHFHIAVLDQGKPELYNRFYYSGAEDFLYYVLFTYEQLGLTTSETPLFLSGIIDEESELYLLGYTYIKEVYLRNDTLLNKPVLGSLHQTSLPKFLTLINSI